MVNRPRNSGKKSDFNVEKIGNTAKVVGYPSLSQSTNTICPFTVFTNKHTNSKFFFNNDISKGIAYLSLRKKIKENGLP